MTENKHLKKDNKIMSLENITVKFDDRIVLNNVNFDVYNGEFIGLIGANGAGKSTLLKVILGLLKPSKGKVNISESKKARNIIGYVPQKIFLEPNIPLRGRDLVSLGIDGHRFGLPIPNKIKQKLVNEMLESVGAMKYADSPVGKLSGGEQQRLLIAQALLTNPKIILLDEPLSNLDIKSSYEMVKLVSNICKEKGVAVIFVAHDMNPLLGAMSRVIYLAKGNAVTGSVNDVFRSDVLTKLYGYPVEVLKIDERIMVMGRQQYYNKPNNLTSDIHSLGGMV